MGASAYEVEITENVAKAVVKATFSVQSATTSNNRQTPYSEYWRFMPESASLRR